jgi:hypothetical protein
VHLLQRENWKAEAIMEFSRIEDAVGKWVIVRFANWPEDLKDPVTGLGDVEGRWLQFKLQGVDNFGIWFENPYFKVSPSSGSESKEIPQERKEALKGKALVLVKWQYVGKAADDFVKRHKNLHARVYRWQTQSTPILRC